MKRWLRRHQHGAGAPWHVVPANHKWYRNLVVAELIVGALKKLKLAYPKARSGNAQGNQNRVAIKG